MEEQKERKDGVKVIYPLNYDGPDLQPETREVAPIELALRVAAVLVVVGMAWYLIFRGLAIG